MKPVFKILFLLLVSILPVSRLYAQLSPLATQYYQNPYLANPSLAGLEGGLRLNVAYRTHMSNVKGIPKNTAVTGEYRYNNVGIGLFFYKDEAGLLNRTKLMGTYAYHVPLTSENQKLHFGISVGVQTGNLNIQGIAGDPDDELALQYNEREIVIDADFGAAYTIDRFTIEGALVNLKKLVLDDALNPADYSTYYGSLSYQFLLNDWQLSPKLVYRGVRNYKDIIDLTMELESYNEQLTFIGMYHSVNSFTLGFGYLYNKQWKFSAFYNSPTAAIKPFSNGSFEIGLQMRFLSSKN